MSYTITQNTSFLTAASILQKVISFAYFTIIARLIGVENTGVYFFAIAFTTIFTVVADFGMGPILTREASRFSEKSSEYLNIVFWSKVLFGLLAYGLVVFFINIFNYPSLTKHLVYLSGVTMFLDNLGAAFYSLFRARKNLIYESISIVGAQGTTLIIGSVALFLQTPLYWLILAYTIPSFLNLLFGAYSLWRVYDLTFVWQFNKDIFKIFLSLSWPFALAGIISRLYAYSDSLLMSKMLSAKELGYWSVPYKITFAFQFLATAVSTSIYPVMSSLFLTEKEKIGELFLKSWRYLFVIIFPLSFGLAVLARPVIIFLYKAQFAPAVPVLQILLFSLIFGFLGFITGTTLNAINRQTTQTALLFVVLLVNIICNFILLPKYGIIGAAFAALISNALLTIGGFWFCKRNIAISGLELFKYFNQTFWPAVVMAGLTYLLVQKMHFILVIPMVALVYFILLFITGAIDKQLIIKFYNKIFKKSVLPN